MNNAKQYTEYSVEQAVKLLSIDSPTGYTFAAEEHLLRTFRELGYAPVHTVKGGIYIPDSAKEKPQEAKVIAVGPGKKDDNGKLIPMDVKVGDTILTSKYGGTEIKIDDKEYKILNASDILAIVE